MFQDRRIAPRRVVDCPGSIVWDGHPASHDCLIADISDGGARIVTAANVPEEFILHLKDGSETSHKCRVVWRLDDELGAEFV